jgi:hypothetical protein
VRRRQTFFASIPAPPSTTRDRDSRVASRLFCDAVLELACNAGNAFWGRSNTSALRRRSNGVDESCGVDPIVNYLHQPGDVR